MTAVRAFVAAVLLAAAVPAAASGQDLVAPDARVHTLAGGGALAPRDGRSATDARLRFDRIAAGPDGSLVFTGLRSTWRIDRDGRLRGLPDLLIDGVPARARDVDFAADGTLLAVADDGAVHRLPAGAAAWQGLPVVSAFPLDEIAALPDGGALVADFRQIWRLDPSGETVWRRRAPLDEIGQLSTDQLVALPGGGLAAIGASSSGVVGLDGAGRQTRLGSGITQAIAVLADGSVVQETGTGLIRLLRPGMRAQPLYGHRPRLGRGDGGPARHALFHPGLREGDALAVGPRGELYVADGSAMDARGTIDREAFRFGASLVTRFTVPNQGELLRVIGGVHPSVAILPASYATDVGRQLAVSSSFAGPARLRITDETGTVTRVGVDEVPAGESSLVLPPLPRGDLHLALTVTDGARSATHRVGLSTRRRLPAARARATVRRVLAKYEDGGDGTAYELHARDCKRATSARISCALWSTYWNFNDAERRCEGRVVARQRSDGIRVELVWRRALCRTR